MNDSTRNAPTREGVLRGGRSPDDVAGPVFREQKGRSPMCRSCTMRRSNEPLIHKHLHVARRFGIT